jgi:glycosyltransferase involved in cell wall biosynthesis
VLSLIFHIPLESSLRKFSTAKKQRGIIYPKRISGLNSEIAKQQIHYPLVTIGIPTYNRANGFLAVALQCAVEQSYPNLEIIVADNCSNDGTSDLVRSFNDMRIQYYRHEVNIGASNNFNFCLDKANGKYFLLLHDDDMIDYDFIEICMKYANYSTEYGLIRTGVRVINERGTVLTESTNSVKGFPHDKFLLSWFNNQTSWYLCNTLYNTDKLRAIGGFRSKCNLLQDCVATVKLSAQEKRVDVEEVKASFRKHSGEITFAVRVKDWAEDFLDLLEMIRVTVPDRNEELLGEAERFFSSLSYKRAAAVKSPVSRMASYFVVWKMFHYKYWPPPMSRIANAISRLCEREAGT